MTIGFDKFKTFDINDELERLRQKAKAEVDARKNIDASKEIVIDMYNYFGKHCEVKYEAIKQRDKRILPALTEGKTVVLDFTEAETATHSFLVALLATPICNTGIKAYKLIKIKGAELIIKELKEENIHNILGIQVGMTLIFLMLFTIRMILN